MNQNSLPPWEVGVRQGGEMNIKVMSKNLIDFKNSMEENNLRFALFFGTLLGVVRQDSFINWDTDVDVICFWEDYLKWHNVKRSLTEKGFNVVEEKPLHDEHIIRDGEKIEIWWMGKIKDELVYDSNIRFKNDLILPFNKMPFQGEIYNIPFRTIAILELLYGKNWKTPCMLTKGCSFKAK